MCIRDSQYSVSNKNGDTMPEDSAVIFDDNGNKVLKLKGSDPDLWVDLLNNDLQASKYGENITTFDFKFPNGIAGYYGMYNELRRAADGTVYRLGITPTDGSHCFLGIKDGNTSGSGKDVAAKIPGTPAKPWFTMMICCLLYTSLSPEFRQLVVDRFVDGF